MPNNAIQMWWPDTCDCAIHLAYDDTLPPDQRVYTPVSWQDAQDIHQARINAGTPGTNPNPQPQHRICEAHTKHKDVKERHAQILKENLNKNIAYSICESQIKGFTPQNFGWTFDASRSLKTYITGITPTSQQQSAIQKAYDTQFGTGLVSLTVGLIPIS